MLTNLVRSMFNVFALCVSMYSEINSAIRVFFSPFIKKLWKSLGIFDRKDFTKTLEGSSLFSLSIFFIENSWYVSVTISTRLYPNGMLLTNFWANPRCEKILDVNKIVMAYSNSFKITGN